MASFLCVYVYKYISIRKCVRVQIENGEAIIFKSLKYIVPLLARFRDSLISTVAIAGSIFLFKKGKCPQNSNVLNAGLFTHESRI